MTKIDLNEAVAKAQAGLEKMRRDLKAFAEGTADEETTRQIQHLIDCHKRWNALYGREELEECT
jgi:hypothetical protein